MAFGAATALSKSLNSMEESHAHCTYSSGKAAGSVARKVLPSERETQHWLSQRRQACDSRQLDLLSRILNVAAPVRLEVSTHRHRKIQRERIALKAPNKAFSALFVVLQVAVQDSRIRAYVTPMSTVLFGVFE